MDAPRFDEMSDAAIDRDLQALLADDPSPAFVARVRTQIAAEAATSRSWLTAWGSVVVATTAIAVVIVTLVGYRGSREQVDAHRAAQTTRPLAISSAVSGAGSLVAGLRGGVLDRSTPTSSVAAHQGAAAAQQTMQTSVAAPQAIASVEPEVLVDPREAAALRAFFARARSGDVPLAAIVAPPATPLPDSHDVHDIYIAPIAFEPVIGAAEDKGVRQ